MLIGSPGDDHILGMGGDDLLEGRGGRDYLRGEDGCVQRLCAGRPLDHDVVRGGEGDDDLASAWGPDDLEGDGGADFLTAGYLHGAHTISGGTGDDAVVVYVRASMDPAIDGGDGRDRLTVIADNPLPAGSRLVVDAGSGGLRTSLPDVRATLSGFEEYSLTGYPSAPTRRVVDFWFIGSDAPELLRVQRYGKTSLHASMGGGDDVVRATDQDDVVKGGLGVDRVHARGGRDRCVDVEQAQSCEVLLPR